MSPLRRLAYWVFKNEWIPLGPLPPHVLLGWALGSKGQRVPTPAKVTPQPNVAAVRGRAKLAMTRNLVVDPEHMVLEYDATWNCERYSETWHDCPTGTADPEYADEEWCRSCHARRALVL